jgi:uncharacterized membrane protein
MYFWTAVFGDSELSVRVPPMLCGLLSIILTYALAIRLTGSRTTGLVAAWWMSVSPVHIWYSQEARSYSPLVFFLLAAMHAYYQMETSEDRVWSWVFLCSLAAAVLSHHYAAVYLVAFSALAEVRGGKNRRVVLLSTGAVLSLLALFLVLRVRFSAFRLGAGYLRPFTLAEMWMLFFNWFAFGNCLWEVRPYHPGAALVSG